MARCRAGEEGAGARARRAGGVRRGRTCALGTDTSAACARLRCRGRRLARHVVPPQMHAPRASAPRGSAGVHRYAAVRGGACGRGVRRCLQGVARRARARARLCRCARRSLRRLAPVSAPLQRAMAPRFVFASVVSRWRQWCAGAVEGVRAHSAAQRVVPLVRAGSGMRCGRRCTRLGSVAHSCVRGGQKDAQVLLHIAFWW